MQPFCNRGDLLAEHPVDGGARHKVALRQLAQAITVLPVPEDGSPIEHQSLPSDVPAFELGSPHAGQRISASISPEQEVTFGETA